MPETISNLSPAVQILRYALRTARESRRVTSRSVSERVGLSHAMVSNWETGRRIPTMAQAAMFVDALGINGEERDTILAYARDANAPNRLSRIPGIPPWLADVIAYERMAWTIEEWAPAIVPDLVQTPDYTRALATSRRYGPVDMETHGLIQAGRREILTRTVDPVEYTAVIGQSALREPIAAPRVMADQLEFLITQTNRPNITIRVMPVSPGWHVGLTGPFSMYCLPDGQECARHDHLVSACVVTARADEYRTGLDLMLSKALSVRESIQWLAEMSKEWCHMARGGE